MIPEFWDELPKIIERIETEAQARVIVISSTGPHFTSGLDTSAFGSTIQDKDDTMAPEKLARLKGVKLYETVAHMQKTFSCLENCRMPVLAAIQGGAIGGGVDLITACDMRYMTQDSFLTIFEINIGMTADVGTFPRLCKLIPEGVVKELAFTGRRMPADEAKSLGLVNQIFEDHEALITGVMELAKQIASKAPLAIYGSKRIINYARDHNTADSLDYISIWNASMLQHDEVQEAMQAAGEKRAGNFVDLPPIKRKLAK
jgi:enoyl-CoA hydratase|tara:strand:- start:172 stop:948 length:777 start_codon:yes stop_codon:yes gene_type:complete